MSIQFKLSATVDSLMVTAIMDKLRAQGAKAAPLFPNPKRASLAGIYSVSLDSRQDYDHIAALLAEFGDAIEYLEQGVTRSPTRESK